MRFLIFIILLAMLISAEGLGGAAVGLLAGLGLDIPIVLLTGSSFMEIFTGWGLIDDVIMAMLRLEWGISDRLLAGIVIQEASHIFFEYLDEQDYTDQQHRAYSRKLQRDHPGTTYLFGDVTERDVIELGLAGGVLAYRQLPLTAFQVGEDISEEVIL